MLRYGKIFKYNALRGKGKIMDSNLQDIDFEMPKNSLFLRIGDQVRFRIEAGSCGLKAVSVKKNLSRIPIKIISHYADDFLISILAFLCEISIFYDT
ncbi:hypothetical protein GCM10008119_14860 [Pedobacter mendelii]|uniref:Uncharacterized protein n=1 Tax=Pedobacter mendelii TaxID=1908240 RepID=A0ABQ2BIB5_9SPHI|nr:hypothetical protein GCM10008119_14860 [Pedobacter mendelii]